MRVYARIPYGDNHGANLGLEFYFALRYTRLGTKLSEIKELPLEEVLRQAKSLDSHLLATSQPVTYIPTPMGATASIQGGVPMPSNASTPVSTQP